MALNKRNTYIADDSAAIEAEEAIEKEKKEQEMRNVSTDKTYSVEEAADRLKARGIKNVTVEDAFLMFTMTVDEWRADPKKALKKCEAIAASVGYNSAIGINTRKGNNNED